MSLIVVEWSSRPLPGSEGFAPSWRLSSTSLLNPVDLVSRPEITDWMYRLRKTTLNDLNILELGRNAYNTASESAVAAHNGAQYATLGCYPWVEAAKLEDLRLPADRFQPARMAGVDISHEMGLAGPRFSLVSRSGAEWYSISRSLEEAECAVAEKLAAQTLRESLHQRLSVWRESQPALFRVRGSVRNGDELEHIHQTMSNIAHHSINEYTRDPHRVTESDWRRVDLQYVPCPGRELQKTVVSLGGSELATLTYPGVPNFSTYPQVPQMGQMMGPWDPKWNQLLTVRSPSPPPSSVHAVAIVPNDTAGITSLSLREQSSNESEVPYP